MLLQLKALVVVLALATVVFMLAKPVCLRFTAPEDFARRRLVWYVLTITGFMSPSFWLYVLIAAPMLAWAAKKDSTPVAIFLLFIFVIPTVTVEIPSIGIKRLFDLNNWRLLGLVVLLPAVVARLQDRTPGQPLRLSSMDVLLLLYGALQLVLFMPYESLTNTARRGFLFMLDTYLVFFACSRLLTSRRSLGDAMGALCLSAAIMAPMAVFESIRFWLLYLEIADRWGDPNVFGWLMRGSSLRSMVSTGHAITLGYMMAMAMGCWLYLKSSQSGKWTNLGVLFLLSCGLVFSYSRGAWLAAVLVGVIFVVLGSVNTAKFAKQVALLVAVTAGFLSTPLGSSLAESLPFMGSQNQDTVEYRQQLAETSWALIQQNPLLGNPFVLLQMEDLRQGQGIIDIVNAYAQVALFYGLVGLALYAGVSLISLLRSYALLRRSRASRDIQLVAFGAALIACSLSNLFFMATAGQSWLQWVLAGLLAAYASLVPSTEPATGVQADRYRDAGRGHRAYANRVPAP